MPVHLWSCYMLKCGIFKKDIWVSIGDFNTEQGHDSICILKVPLHLTQNEKRVVGQERMLEEQFEAIGELQVIVMVCIRSTYECGRVCWHLRC